MKYEEYKKHHDKKFRKLASLLKNKLPCAFPVKIRRISNVGKRHSGVCFLLKEGTQKYFLIQIEKSQHLDSHEGRAFELEALIHEYAHARCWNYLQDKAETSEDYHMAEWGISYAECYRIWLSME